MSNILSAKIQVTAPGVKEAFDSVVAGVTKTDAIVKKTIPAISALGDSIETLRAKALAKQQFLITEKDITKIAILNKEIDQLLSEISRLSNVGKAGFDALGNKIIVTKSQIDLLANQIKKGTSSFSILGKAGQLAGSSLGGLTGVLNTTKSSVSAIIPETDKLKSGFLSVAGGAGKAFSVLRQVAFILPGIGIAGLIGGLSDLVISLFKSSDAFKDSELKAALFTAEMNRAKDAVDEFVKSLDFEADINKLKAKLKFGDGLKADLAIFKIDKQANDTIIETANSEIRRITDRIGQLRANASFFLSKSGQDLLEAFPIDAEIPDDLISKLTESDKKVIQEIKSSAEIISAQERVRLKAFSENSKAEIEIKIKTNEELKKLNKKRLKDAEDDYNVLKGLLDLQGKSVLGLQNTFKLGLEKLSKARADMQKDIGTGVETIFNIKFISGSNFDNFSKPAKEVSDRLQSEVDRLIKNNPILIKGDAFTLDLTATNDNIKKQLEDINSTFKDTVGDVFGNIGETLGEALSGGDLQKGIQSLFSAIASGIQSIGKQFIKIGVLALLAKDAFKKLFSNPALSIAVGIALVAAGAALKNTLQGRAGGGRVNKGQPYIVGEVGKEIFVPDTGGTIVPNNKIAAAGSPMQGGGGMVVRIIGEFVQRGNDLVAAIANTNRAQGRLT